MRERRELPYWYTSEPAYHNSAVLTACAHSGLSVGRALRHLFSFAEDMQQAARRALEAQAPSYIIPLDTEELATLRADLARVTAELTLTEKRRAEAQRAVHAAMVNLGTLQDQVRELQKVARAAVAWRDQGARSKWATGPSLTLWDVVDALPPSMLEEPSEADEVRAFGAAIEVAERALGRRE